MNEIFKILEVLRSCDFYGAGKHVEIAKGSNEIVTDWQGIKRKVKRIIKK
tara:strand:- start:3843 stop:3992 length:150 start_codon:yes stop_codon:yes gene_type:complete